MPDEPSWVTLLIVGDGVDVEASINETVTRNAVVRTIGPRKGIGWTITGDTSSSCMNSNSTDMHGSEAQGRGVMMTRFLPTVVIGDRNSTYEVRGSSPGGRIRVLLLAA
eukprot:586930-Rhodomonas_salina.1